MPLLMLRLKMRLKMRWKTFKYEVKNEVPNITNLAITAALAAVKIKYLMWMI